MKSKSSNITVKEREFFEKLKNGEPLSVSEIEKILNCKRTSVYNYLKRLKDKGVVFKETMIKNKVYYSLEEMQATENTMEYFPMTFDILRKYTIVQSLQSNPVEKEKLRKKFSVYKPNERRGDGERVILDVKLTHYYDLLKSLVCEEKEIELNKHDNKYYLTGKEIPFIWKLDEDKMETIYAELENIPPKSPYDKQLFSIYQKLSLLRGNIDNRLPFYDHYLVYGRRTNAFNENHKFLKEFSNYDFKNKILNIHYKSDKEIDFAVGMIVYNSEKDKLYLLGENSHEKNIERKYTIINTDTIDHISETEKLNCCYNTKYYHDMVERMFSISVEKPVYVLVEFDNILNIKRKIRQLKAKRKKSDFKIQDDKILYEDEISGLSDFANYLRQFGKSVRAIEPAELKERMRATVERTLMRYEEE